MGGFASNRAWNIPLRCHARSKTICRLISMTPGRLGGRRFGEGANGAPPSWPELSEMRGLASD